ncbi:MAG: NYN domain-containing protein [Candidatus Magasanikbacteria bacterium]
MPKTASQRVGIFVDVQNIYHSAKNLHNARVNFSNLLEGLVGDRDLIRSVAYVVKSDSTLGEKSFFEALEKAGFELRIKDLKVYSSGVKKADWDVGMAVDAIRIAKDLDVVILVTGDGDFIPLVEYLKWGLGKQIEVAAFEKATSSNLKETADRFIEIADINNSLMDIPNK